VISADDTAFIDLGTVTLRLGMLKKEVLQKLDDSSLIVTNVPTLSGKPSGQSLFVSPKHSPDDSLGQIIFRDDKLVWIAKFWGHFDSKNAYSFLKILFNILGKIMDEDQVLAEIHTGFQAEPDYETRRIDLFITPYEITIFFTDREDQSKGKSVTIIQMLKDYKNPP